MDFDNLFNAVIDETAYDRILGYINLAHSSPDTSVIYGGKGNKSIGYFIAPTIIQTNDPHFITMEEEIFGPVLTAYVYEDKEVDQALSLVDNTSPYGLTGSVFAKDRNFISHATDCLSQAAGNFYINDKPTGAVVGQQPFGGSRGSGTNDKAGSILNLYRWISPRTIKENFVPDRKYQYPFMRAGQDKPEIKVA